MSRIDRPVVWEAYFGEKEKVLCLCCGRVEIQRDAPRFATGAWDRGHVIPAKDGGPDIIENVRPICEGCNTEDKPPKYPTSYHYMVEKGYMAQEKCDSLLTIIKNIQIASTTNPLVMRCIGKISSGSRCTNNKKGFGLLCGVHEKNAVQHIKVYESECLSQIMKGFMSKLQETKFINDPEAIKINQEALRGLKEFM